MKKLLCFVALLLSLTAVASVPVSVSKAVKQANDAAALKIECVINDMPASLSMSGECFLMDFGQSKIYYDGTTQWAYNAEDAEVTIVEPTVEELNMTNPLRILARLSVDYEGTVLPNGRNTVRLTPLSANNDIAEVTVTFSSQTGWPTKMTIITGAGRADIDNIAFTVSDAQTPVTAFRFKMPQGITTIDLR